MSIRLMTAVWDRYEGSGSELLLALALADHASDDGTRVYPSVSSLAAKTRQSERAVQYQLRNMEQKGWLQLVANEGGGRGKAREYRINPEWVSGGTKGADSAPFLPKGCKPEQERVQNDAQKGATAIAPESSVEPSKETPKEGVPDGTCDQRVRVPAFQPIADHWNARLPELQAIRIIGSSRLKSFGARCKELAAATGGRSLQTEFWIDLIDYVAESDFLMGRVKSINGRQPFKITIDWLLGSENIVKVIEGAYHRKLA